MAKAKTPSFILTLRLKTELFQVHRLNKKFDYVRFLYNRLTDEGYIRYNNLINDIEYKKIKDIKDYKDRLKKISELKTKYKFTEYDFHQHIGYLKNEYKDNLKVGINILQKEASKCFQAFIKLIDKDAKQVHYKKYGTQTSVECKKANDKIKFTQIDNKYFVKWNKDNKLIMPVIIKKNDVFAKNCIKNYKIKFCRLIKEIVNSKEVFYVQIVFDGIPPTKIKKDGSFRHTIGTSDVGIDNGVSTMAIVSDNAVKMCELCEGIDSIEKEVSRLYRAMNRSRIATNPLNYNQNGTIKSDTDNFKKEWIRSKNYMKIYFKFKELNRKLSAIRKQSHNKLANYVLSLGTNIKTEDVSYKALTRRCKETKIGSNSRYKSKKRFGKSILHKSPSMFLRILDTKLKYYGSSLQYINSREIKASQYNHIDDEYRKKTLSQRWNNFIYNDNRIKVQRDLYSAYLIKNVDNTLKNLNIDNLNKNFDDFLKLHDVEIDRLKSILENKKLPSSMGVK